MQPIILLKVLMFSFQYGIIIGVAVSLVLLLVPWNKPDVSVSSFNELTY